MKTKKILLAALVIGSFCGFGSMNADAYWYRCGGWHHHYHHHHWCYTSCRYGFWVDRWGNHHCR